ncbi:TPA: hypothetical protein N0F65_011299 [Lagenidium giganteum]|uniref:Uncharacterized protein n=1 Tax=Lagenidium giganteum TaxID=4803 RepID=A0AAV2YR51_9STRA|nr:TPA: hypothetical protein N0F65_011299 [Lagenidium giganteum]
MYYGASSRRRDGPASAHKVLASTSPTYAPSVQLEACMALTSLSVRMVDAV